MGFSYEIFAKAQARLEKSKQNAERTAEENKKIAFEKIPELETIQQEIAQCGLDLIAAVSMKNDSAAFVSSLRDKSLSAQARRKELLVKNGYPEDFLIPPYSCPKCSDTGSTDDGICDCLISAMKELEIEEIAAFAPIDRCSFDNFDLSYYPEEPVNGIIPRKRMQQIFDYCKSYAEDFSTVSPSIYMHGATGLGKTHLALAIARSAVQKGCGVIYSSAPNLFSSFEREKFNRRTSSDIYTEQDAIETDLLIIDDLGAEFSTLYTVSAIYNVINSRLLSGKPTIITTNLTPQEFESKYSQRITSRITGGYTSLLFMGRDIRQIKKYQNR